jgi:hypothetical protein
MENKDLYNLWKEQDIKELELLEYDDSICSLEKEMFRNSTERNSTDKPLAQEFEDWWKRNNS